MERIAAAKWFCQTIKKITLIILRFISSYDYSVEYNTPEYECQKQQNILMKNVLIAIVFLQINSKIKNTTTRKCKALFEIVS